MTTDYRALPSDAVIARLERVHQFIVVDDGQAPEDQRPELLEALDTIIPLLEDIRSALSDESLAKAKAFAAAVKEATQ